jgi:hypothetical protein
VVAIMVSRYVQRSVTAICFLLSVSSFISNAVWTQTRSHIVCKYRL